MTRSTQYEHHSKKGYDPFSGRRIAILISGRGSNLQAIIDAIANGRLEATIAIVISNRSDAQGLIRAREAGIEALCLNPRDHPSRDLYDRAIVDVLRARVLRHLVTGYAIASAMAGLAGALSAQTNAFVGLDAYNTARAFAAAINEACEKTGWAIHAYVLIGNH